MSQLKSILLQEYGSFADKRIKRLEKAKTFTVDDRSEADCGAKGLYSCFCMIFADVESENRVTITLLGNVPKSTKVQAWLDKHDLATSKNLNGELLRFEITPSSYTILGS